MTKSGISFSIATVRGMGTRRERNFALEFGVWPYKDKYNRLWVTTATTADNEEATSTEWGMNLKNPFQIVWGWVKESWVIRKLSSLFGRTTSAE